MVSFRLLWWKEAYTIAATPFRETLLVNNLHYPPPAQSPFTKKSWAATFSRLHVGLFGRFRPPLFLRRYETAFSLCAAKAAFSLDCCFQFQQTFL